eukprot:Pgem_evm1s18485
MINGLPLHILKLKPNCPIMLLRNICPAKGLCNGTRLKVIQLHDHIIEAEITTEGKFYGSTTYIPRIDLIPTDVDLPFHFRRQFP